MQFEIIVSRRAFCYVSTKVSKGFADSFVGVGVRLAMNCAPYKEGGLEPGAVSISSTFFYSENGDNSFL